MKAAAKIRIRNFMAFGQTIAYGLDGRLDNFAARGVKILKRCRLRNIYRGFQARRQACLGRRRPGRDCEGCLARTTTFTVLLLHGRW